MKIVFTVDSLHIEHGGPSRSVPALAKAISGLGVQVELWTLSGSEVVDGLTVRRFDSVFKLAKSLRKEDTNGLLVHDNGLWRPFNWIVTRTALANRIPYVISPRGMLDPWCLRQSRFKKRVAWQLYQRRLVGNAAFLHATGVLEEQNLKELGLKVPVVVVSNGIDIPDVQHNASATQRMVLYLSRVHRQKGIEVLFRAWASIRPVGWQLHIAGSGDPVYLTELKRLVSHLEIADHVKWLGEVGGESKSAVYAEADVFVLPSFSESFGIVVAEALASGTPVITTTGTPWLTLEAERCGLRVDPTVEGLARALKALLLDTSPESLAAMGARGREWMARSFSWKSVSTLMLNAYEKVLK
jgi:glycosyltransferase involved in cell wall biosynthesis